jgi:plastocyanin
MALVLFGFSRVLLSLSHDAATATALVVALTIVVMAAVVAGRRYVRLSSLMGMVGAVVGVAMIAGGVAVATGGEGEGGGGGGKVATINLVAVNIAFQQTRLTVPAGEPFRIVFQNQDAGVQHNVRIFDNPDYSGTTIFQGDLVTGPATVTYDVPALEAGTYAFDCVVHPNMQGTIEAVEGGGGGGGGGGASITVSAQNTAFDTDTIELPPNTPATITFKNEDAGIQHNIAIYQDDTLAQNLFRGELVTGPATAEYQIPPLPPGTYYFQCDVHPAMNGKVVVGGGSETAGTGPTPSGSASGSMSSMMPSMSPMMGSTPSMTGPPTPTGT